MPTTVWFQNPESYVRELVTSVISPKLYWTAKYIKSRHVDPSKFAISFLRGTNYEYMVEESFGVTHFTEAGGQVATYPSWDYEHDTLDMLYAMAEAPPSVTAAMSLPDEQQPRIGQRHIIALLNIPTAALNSVKDFYRRAQAMQDELEVEFFIPELSSFRIAFQLGFSAVAMSPVATAEGGAIVVPSGKSVPNDQIKRFPAWTRMFGHTPSQLASEFKARVAYNICSIEFARDNWFKLVNPKLNATADPNEPGELVQSKGSALATKPKAQPVLLGDKQTCDTCSLSGACVYAREGAVCTVPGTQGESLSEYFGSRDASKIIDGLSRLTAKQAERLERKLGEEEMFGDDEKLSSEITKLAAQLFNQGVNLAKLLDPNLRGGTKVQVNVAGNGQAAVALAPQNPREMMASVVRALEDSGVPRSQQTDKMIENMLKLMSASPDQQKTAIEAATRTDAAYQVVDASSSPF